MAEAQVRCVGCGKLIEDGEDYRRIVEGKVRDGEFEDKKEYGRMHRSCYNRRADAPQATMDELRRQAKTAASR